MENDIDNEYRNPPHQFIVMWDMYGIEAVIDVTALEMSEVLVALQTGKTGHAKTSWQATLNAMQFRARYNSQRHYEIYGVLATDGISESDIREMFENAPQEAAETIRRLGVPIFSDRIKEDSKIVIR